MKHIGQKSATKTKWILIASGCAIGCAVFLLVYGWQVLVPTNVDWLLTSGDASQHYIGWEFYRQSDWTFPIGVAQDLAYPHGLAITFMDSLPLFAVPSKLLAGILPEHFQYFGIWGLLSYMSMGAISALIMRRWTTDWRIILTTAVFVCFSPIVFQRMFMHTALAGQWIILLAIYAVVCCNQWHLRKNAVMWSIILSLSVLIHPYFLAMNGFLLCVSTILRYKTVRRATIELLVPISVAVITTWIIGGLRFATISGDKFGGAGYDLASPILGDGWSIISSPITTRFEMFGYLGLGGILLVAIATFICIRNWGHIAPIIDKHRQKTVALVVLFVVLLVVAAGPGIAAGGVQIIQYHVPATIEKIWGIFRVTARLAWPLWYLAIFAGLFIVLRFVKNRQLVWGIILIVCVVQVIDIGLSSQLHQRHQMLQNVQSARFHTSLTDPIWTEVAAGRSHIVYLGDLYDEKFVTIAQYAIAHKLTLNTGYFARKPTRDIERTILDAKNDLQKSKLDAKTIYIYDKPYAVASGVAQQTIDNYIVTVGTK